MIRIAATGMVTALGMSSEASCAAIRAGLAAFQEVPFVNGGGHPVIASPARQRLGGLLGIHLLTEMAFLSVQECLGEEPLSEIPLLLAVSEKDRAGRPPGLEDRVLAAISGRLTDRLHPESSVFTAGGTACFQAIRQASALLAGGRARACLVCGTDSLIDADQLRALDRSQRLKTPVNPDGLIPGEAAACLLLVPHAGPAGPGTVLICGLGFSREEATVGSGRPVLGVGLASAMKAALEDAALTMETIDFRIGDVTGERYGFLEANYALGRVLRVRKESFEFLHLMDSIGTVGAASGACMLAYVKYLIERGVVPGRGALCEAGSDEGERAVAVVTGSPWTNT